MLQLDRRAFLSLAAAAGATALLAGCAPQQGATQNGAFGKLPTFTPAKGPAPTIAGDLSRDILDVFTEYPANPPKSVHEVPGDGSEVTGLIFISDAGAGPGKGSNAFWQNVDKKVNARLNLTSIVQGQDAITKTQSLIAGNDLPELVQFDTKFPQLAGVLPAKFTDLSEFIGGNAISEYPNLAGIPQQYWRGAAFNGGIFGIPLVFGRTTFVMQVRQDIFDSMGLEAKVSSKQDFLDLCKELTRPSANKWAIGNARGTLNYAKEMMGARTVWFEKGGKFTHTYETDEFVEALDYVRGMWAAGYMHPDSFAGQESLEQLFAGGTIAMTGLSSIYDMPYYLENYTAAFPELRITPMAPPEYTSGSTRKAGYPGVYSLLAIRKTTDKARVKRLLSLLNWFAAPFGTSEYLTNRYGVEGTDYTLKGTDPILTEKGINETKIQLQFLARSVDPLYVAGRPDAARALDSYQRVVAPNLDVDAAFGLQSKTFDRNGTTLTTDITDAQNQILQGRAPVSAWKDAVAAWRKNGGDAMRAEYERSFAAAPWN
jgi:putative aldouronate transport system substrate-binding protein